MSETVNLVGLVRVERVAKGSKSSRRAPVLVTASGELLLRMLSGESFGPSEFDALDGQRISAEGYRDGNQFLVVRYQHQEVGLVAAPDHSNESGMIPSRHDTAGY